MKRDLVAGLAGKFMSSLGDSQPIRGTEHLGPSVRGYCMSSLSRLKEQGR